MCLVESSGRSIGPPRPARVGVLSPTPPVSPSVCGGGWCDSDWLCAAASRFLVSCFAAALLIAVSAYDADVVYGVLSAFGPFDDVVCFCAVGLLADDVVECGVAERARVLSLCLCSAFGLCCESLPLRSSCAACRHGVLVVVCCCVCAVRAVQRAVRWCGGCGCAAAAVLLRLCAVLCGVCGAVLVSCCCAVVAASAAVLSWPRVLLCCRGRECCWCCVVVALVWRVLRCAVLLCVAWESVVAPVLVLWGPRGGWGSLLCCVSPVSVGGPWVGWPCPLCDGPGPGFAGAPRGGLGSPVCWWGWVFGFPGLCWWGWPLRGVRPLWGGPGPGGAGAR